jgi:hypothetical protein
LFAGETAHHITPNAISGKALIFGRKYSKGVAGSAHLERPIVWQLEIRIRK